jgi:hypothetical protein
MAVAALMVLLSYCVVTATAAVSAGERASLMDFFHNMTKFGVGAPLSITWGVGDPCVDVWFGVECNVGNDRVEYVTYHRTVSAALLVAATVFAAPAPTHLHRPLNFECCFHGC